MGLVPKAVFTFKQSYSGENTPEYDCLNVNTASGTNPIPNHKLLSLSSFLCSLEECVGS